MWKFKIDTTSGDLENGNSFQHVANVQFPMCKNPFSIHFLFPANWFHMKKCSFSAWPPKKWREFFNQWSYGNVFFFMRKLPQKMSGPARPKDPQQDGGSGIGRGIPFLFVGAWWVTFFFSGLQLLKTLVRSDRGLSKLFCFEKLFALKLGEMIQWETCASVFFFQWVAQTTGSPTNQLNPHGGNRVSRR